MSDSEGSSGSELVSLDEAYAVEEIRSHKVVNGVDFYLVKWLGYAEAQNTWEPADNLKTVKNMIEDFMEKFENAKKDRESKKSGIQGKAKSEEEAVASGAPQSIAAVKTKTTAETKTKATKSTVKPAKQSATSEASNPPEKKKAPAQQDKANVEHFKNVIKESKPASKKREDKDAEPREPRRYEPARANKESKEAREARNSSRSEDEPAGGMAAEIEADLSEGAPTKKPRLEDNATQQPEHQIRKVNFVTVKNDEIYYQVEYAKKSEQRVNLLPASVVLRENPTAIAEFFQNRLRMLPEETNGH